MPQGRIQLTSIDQQSMSSFQFNDSEASGPGLDIISHIASNKVLFNNASHEKYIQSLQRKTLKENTLQDQGLKRLMTKRKQI